MVGYGCGACAARGDGARRRSVCFLRQQRVRSSLLGHCSSGAAFVAALSIGIDGRKSRDPDAGLRLVGRPRKCDFWPDF